MFESVSRWVLRVLRVPDEPEPPSGAPASARVFRAGHNYLRFRLCLWSFKQVLALAVIVFWAVVFIQIEQSVRVRRQEGRTPVALTSAKDFSEYLEKVGAAERPLPPTVGTAAPAASGTAAEMTVATEGRPDPARSGNGPRKPSRRVRIDGWNGFKQMLVEMALHLPDGSFLLIWTLKVAGFVLYLVQIPVTYALMRLDYEQRWYIVTDRSLRLRTGIWKVREMTMSFANLQQIAVSQGPLQRLLGLADVRVQSAGGGSAQPGDPTPGQRSLHTGHFHAVDNAEEIRDLIVERLRLFRETGLGDPDEVPRGAGLGSARGDRPELAAAQVLLAEARALRSVLR
jgi:hypothetical protein